MFLLSATMNVIWGIAAVSNSHFFVGNASYILSDLNTWGWVAMGFAALEVLAALSIFRGGTFGRWFGIIVAGFAVVAAMMSIPPIRSGRSCWMRSASWSSTRSRPTATSRNRPCSDPCPSKRLRPCETSAAVCLCRHRSLRHQGQAARVTRAAAPGLVTQTESPG